MPDTQLPTPPTGSSQNLPDCMHRATSAEFCIASTQDGSDCESVQFISGIVQQIQMAPDPASNPTPHPTSSGSDPTKPAHPADATDPAGSSADSASAASNLLLSYGVNDCEAKIGAVSMRRLWRMLVPLPDERAACEPQA